MRVEVLSADITASVNSAVAALNDFAGALGNVRNEAQATSKTVKDIGGNLKKTKDEVKRVTAAVKEQAGAFGKLASSLKRIAFYRAIRSALKAVTQGIREGINNLVLYSAAMNSLDSASASNSMNEFATMALYVKNSVATALMPILTMLVPVIWRITDAFVSAVNAINEFFHAITGLGGGKFTKANKYAVDYADSLKKAGGAAKELKKQVFGFDELNIFNKPSSGGSGGGGGLDATEMFKEANVRENWANLRKKIKAELDAIEIIVGAALLAVGAILALSGINPALGIALMGAGAASIAAGMLNWDGTDTNIKNALVKITGTVGGMLLALGAILLLSGANPPLGIGLVAAGAVALASSIGINWDLMGNTIDEKMGFIAAVVGGAFLALGAILAISGANIPLGIGLMLVGAASLASGVGMNDTLKNLIAQNIGLVEALVGGAFLFLGVIALCSGHIPLGIPLIIAGAYLLGKGEKDLNDTLRQKIGSKLQTIKELVLKGMAVIGGVLLFVNPALGIPLLISSLALSAMDLDWDYLYNKISTKWAAIKGKLATIKSDISGFVESIKNFFKELFGLNGSLKVDKPSQGQNPWGFERRASGGWVESGTIFLAGEAGPELVGQVNGRTNVTNQEQFTAGMVDIMDNTNTVIMQAAQALIQAIQSKPVPSIRIGDRDIVSMYDRGKTLAGGALVE